MRGFGRGVFRATIATAVLGCSLVLVAPGSARADDVIRIAPAAPPTDEPEASALEGGAVGGRRGSAYDAFRSRLDALWFQRRAFLAGGREADAAKQADLIRPCASEEGVRRLEAPAGALLAEAEQYVDEGNFEKALSTLDLAEALDPGRPEIRAARARVVWKSGAGLLRAGAEHARAWRIATVLKGGGMGPN